MNLQHFYYNIDRLLNKLKIQNYKTLVVMTFWYVTKFWLYNKKSNLTTW